MVVINDAAIVTVRNSSTRLPNKAIAKIKSNLRAIDIVVERAKKTGFPVIIATSNAADDDVFVDVAKQHGVHIFRGSLLNKIKRWYDCFNEYDIENALLIDGDDLAHNYDIGSRAMLELKSGKFDIIINPDDIITGFFTYAIRRSAIVKMYAIAPSEETNTDVPTRYVEKASLNVFYIKLHDYERNRKIRLTLDYEEDLKFFRTLYENVDVLESGKGIIDFLDKNNFISQINFYRQNDYLQNQAKFNANVK